jgi:hypothetical protein
LHYAEPVDAPSAIDRAHSTRFRVGAAAVIVLGIALIVWLALRDEHGGTRASTNNAKAVSEQQLHALARTTGHPLYWLGPKPGYTYELSTNANGAVFIRYLPRGAPVGDTTPYLTVATYPFANALAALQKLRGATDMSFRVPRDGYAEFTTSYPASVHLAYPHDDVQIEIYDPAPGRAKALALAGRVTAL